MEENEEENQTQGVIKTVASPTVLAAILDQSIDDKQTLNSLEETSLEAKCLLNSEPETNLSFGMDRSQEESVLNDSFVDDSLELTERSLDSELNESKKQQSEVTTLSENILRINTGNNSSSDAKPLYKTVKNKQITKQKAKETNFIDLNKERLNRTSGKNSYASMYSQKVKQKQTTSKKNQDKDDTITEKGKDAKQPPFSYDSTKQSSYSSIPLVDRVSSLSIHDPNHHKSAYYYVDPSYAQNNHNNPYPLANQTIIGYDSYLTQPYHAPYKDFGLRYSNHGHQSYMAPGSLGYANNTYVNQTQPYSSQSAPPGAPIRQPLLDQVEFFPEQEHFLSRSLSNSQFINPQQLYQRELVLERRFVSEPQLSSVLERGKDNNSSDVTPRKPEYKPYTLKEYKQINDPLDKLGGLGPDTESDEYKEKISKLTKQREYAEMLRIDHAAKKKQWAKKPAVIGPSARFQQAEAKRQAAMNYAKSIPKPKVSDNNNQPKGPKQTTVIKNDHDTPLIEQLRLRHLQEKQQVEALKKEIMSKAEN